MSKKIIFPNGIPVCRDCGAELTNDNWSPSKRNRLYRCNPCEVKRVKEWCIKNPEKNKLRRERCSIADGHIPMNENRECASYLGVYIAEQVLSKAFKDVKRMPFHHPYDFICNHGKWIDVKSACARASRNGTLQWHFNFCRNQIADYFLCLAFDNRNDLNPVHIWLLPAKKFNHLTGTSISVTTIKRWDEYRLEVDKVTECCDTMKTSH